MNGIKAIWRAGINMLSDSPLIVPGKNDNVLTIRLCTLERFARCIDDGLDEMDDYYESQRDGWHANGGHRIPPERLADLLNRGGHIIRITAMPDADVNVGDDVTVVNALLYIARYNPDLYVIFDAKENA